ncbi:MAG: ABC transporter ATP-binding protein [Hyphomicrobiales bacterium]|nr:MAG: ABC transporter ATP-binding protein [Hyphomicrobiales bacterium]
MTALEQIDFKIADGEFVSLLGASGCGKSTLLRIISGFDRPSRGQVLIYGEDLTNRLPERRPTNMVFQRGALFPHMSVRENVGYGLRLRGVQRAQINARVDEMLALVRLEALGDRDPAQLSGGQAQRVALARALAAEPRVLLLDEPLSALDLKLRQQMQLELRAIQKRLGATFVFVTHDQTEALVMSDRIAIMNAGRIEQYGTPRDIYRRPSSIFVSDFVGATNLLRGHVSGLSADGVTLDTEVGTLHAAIGPGLQLGQRVALSIRPEAIRVGRGAGASADRQIAGAIAEIVYQGNSIRLRVVVAGSVSVWVECRDEEADGLGIGNDVTLSWAAGAANLLRES